MRPDQDAARGILSAMMLDPKAIALGLRALRPDAMPGALGKVLAAVRTIHGRSDAVDLVTVVAELERTGTLNAVGGASFVAECQSGSCPLSHIDAYAKILNETAKGRAFVAALGQARVEMQSPESVNDSIAGLMRHVADIQSNSSERQPRLIGEIHRAESEAPRAHSVSWGFRALDRATNGIHGGELTLLAARTSVGKSAFAIAVADHCARDGNEVLFFSIEMSELSIANRVAALHGAMLHQVRFERDSITVKSAIAAASEMQIRVLHMVPTVADMRAIVSLQNKLPSLVIVDYLQRVAPSRKSRNRYEDVDEIAHDLKQMSLEFNIPLLVLAQTGRAAEENIGNNLKARRPIMRDLRESGGIEIATDTLVFLHRPNFIVRPNDSETDVIIEKSRDGERQTTHLAFIPEYATFRDSDLASYDQEFSRFTPPPVTHWAGETNGHDKGTLGF